MRTAAFETNSIVTERSDETSRNECQRSRKLDSCKQGTVKMAFSFAKMITRKSDQCRCGKESETVVYLQIRCELPERK